MSHEQPRHDRRVVPTVTRAVRGCYLGAVGRVRALAFWLAICLPWLVLGLVFAGYVGRHPHLLAGLVASTGLCGLVGRDHGR